MYQIQVIVDHREYDINMFNIVWILSDTPSRLLCHQINDTCYVEQVIHLSTSIDLCVELHVIRDFPFIINGICEETAADKWDLLAALSSFIYPGIIILQYLCTCNCQIK